MPGAPTCSTRAVDGVLVKSTRDAIRLPVVLDGTAVDELRARIEHAGAAAWLVLDGSYLQRVETTAVQRLCALVLSAEGRGATVTWIRMSATLVNYAKLLGIAEIMRFADAPLRVRESNG